MARRQDADAQTILRIGIVAAIFAGVLSIAAWALGLDVPSPENDANSAVRDDPRIAVLGQMSDRIPESSGVAASHRHDGILWTHNDQGRGPRLFAVSLDGGLRSSIVVEGAQAIDWEDIALAPCPAALTSLSGDCLYIADTGDNTETRDTYTIDILQEPDPSAEETTVRVAARLSVRYADGPADTESLALTPEGDLLLITKGLGGEAVLYRIPAAAITAEGSAPIYQADPVGTLPLDVSTRSKRITGAAISPDGRTLAVRSLTSVYLFDTAQPLVAPRLCDLGPRQPQGEGVDFLDNGTLILTSERVGGDAPILRVRCERAP